MWLGPHWWGDDNPEVPFSFSLRLGHRRQKRQNGGVRTPINRNDPSIVDHMFFFQMGTSSSRVLEGSPLACLLKCWKDINPDNLCKKALRFFCTQAWPQYPLRDQEK
jgi:hypothetical protein